MEKPAITVQPMPSAENAEKLQEAVQSDKFNGPYVEQSLNEVKEVTAVFPPDSDHNQNEEEKEKRCGEQKEDVTDCCCVYSADTFDYYLCCHLIMDCFRCIGECTDSCFEDCASCLSNCCEDNGGDSGNTDAGCVDCCSGCDSDS